MSFQEGPKDTPLLKKVLFWYRMVCLWIKSPRLNEWDDRGFLWSPLPTQTRLLSSACVLCQLPSTLLYYLNVTR